MKPFDLEAAKAGKPIICRDGTHAELLLFTEKVAGNQQVIYVRNGDVAVVGLDGKASLVLKESSHDLFMAPEKRTVWVNIYKGPTGTFFSTEAGDYLMGLPKCARIEVTYTEGDGL